MHAANGHSHGSHKHDPKEGSCCSTLKAVVQTAKPMVVSQPVLPANPWLCVLLETYAASPARLLTRLCTNIIAPPPATVAITIHALCRKKLPLDSLIVFPPGPTLTDPRPRRTPR